MQRRFLSLALVLLASTVGFAQSSDVWIPGADDSPRPELSPTPSLITPFAATALFNNGPLTTHPGAGAGGADASAVQTALGMTLYGSNAANAPFRVADDFTITGPTGWDISEFIFYAYQTGSTTTSTITSTTFRIWDGPPGGAGSTIIFGDTTTNRLASTTWSGIYRTLDTDLTNVQRPVMANRATANITLAPGTYWVDYAFTGSLASGPWVPPVSIVGQTTTGNALQYNGTDWVALADGGTVTPQGIPFVIEGSALTPINLVIDAAGNRVMETGEVATVSPEWRNDSGVTVPSLTGTLSNFIGPAGPTYTILDGAANYGSIAAGGTAGCASTGDCYSLFVTAAARPVTHWDTTVLETLSAGDTKTWTLHIGGTFTDVLNTSPFYRFIETLVHKGVTGGCGPSSYCPANASTREQMAVFALVSKEGAGYTPPACAPPNLFADVPDTSPFCRFVEELANRGVVSGCAPGFYCPSSAVNREQMSVFALRTLDSTLNPPACVAGSEMFADVPATSPFCRWVEELARRGVVSGCGGGSYCPRNPVTREQMGVFLSVTFGLSLYQP